MPTSSSWLNLVERWFGESDGKAIRRGVFRSVEDLQTAIDAFLQGLERESETLRLDGDSRIDHGEARSLPTNPGADPARLHQPAEQKTEEIAVQLFRGHYTSLSGSERLARVSNDQLGTERFRQRRQEFGIEVSVATEIAAAGFADTIPA